MFEAGLGDAENGEFVPGGGAGARVLVHTDGRGQERDIIGLQVVVRDRAVVPEEDLRGELLRGGAEDGDQEVPGGEIYRAEGEAALRGLQPGAGRLGSLRAPLDRRHGRRLSLARGDPPQTDGHHRREPRAHCQVLQKLQGLGPLLLRGLQHRRPCRHCRQLQVFFSVLSLSRLIGFVVFGWVENGRGEKGGKKSFGLWFGSWLNLVGSCLVAGKSCVNER